MPSFASVNPVSLPGGSMLNQHLEPTDPPLTARGGSFTMPAPKQLDTPMDGSSGHAAGHEQGNIVSTGPDTQPNNGSHTHTTSMGSPGGRLSGDGSSAHSSMHEDKSAGSSEGEPEVSDNEQEPAGPSGPPSKKKKGQRFYCTEFPPCTLSFTRSEHLARHIRKHTGERPFQCHCSRRFSRLDNLRQHAQTVHVNEDIPGDSLAAVGTRFQRQIRTDRVRAPGRARAGTAGSHGGHSRGHSRNLSASSIASNVSTYSQPPEIRRRPPPLMMANDATARAKLSLEMSSPRTPPGQPIVYPGQSPSSAIFSPSTPYSTAGDFYGSPASAGAGFWGERAAAARRLSVPSGSRPFDFHASTYPSPYPRPIAPSNGYVSSGSMFGSPVSPQTPRDDSAADADWRRRTWHPSSASTSAFSRPATSGLWYNQSADAHPPPFALKTESTQDQPPRLPGIESFDAVQLRTDAPPRREPTPMQVDSVGQQSQPPPLTVGPTFTPYPSHAPTGHPPPPVSGPGHRRGHVSFDMGLHHNLTKLDIRGSGSSNDHPQWGQQNAGDMRSIPAHAPVSSQQPSSQEARQVTDPQPQTDTRGPTTPTQNPTQKKRLGWYNGPPPQTPQGSQPLHASPEDSSSSEGVATPSAPPAEYHPAIVHPNSDVEKHHSHAGMDSAHQTSPQQSETKLYPNNEDSKTRAEFYSGNATRGNDMAGLEALVAVATRESGDSGKFL